MVKGDFDKKVNSVIEKLTLSYNEMLRGKNTGRDRKKVKKLLRK